MSIEQDVADWDADMDAWHLDTIQRVHHLHRLHRYHGRLMDRYQGEADRLDRWQLVLGVMLAVSLFITGLLV